MTASQRLLGLDVIQSVKPTSNDLQVAEIVLLDTSQTKSHKKLWKMDKSSTLIYKSSENDNDLLWHEMNMETNQQTQTYHQVTDDNNNDDEVILLSMRFTTANIYVRLTSEFAFYGSESVNETNVVIGDGHWIELVSWRTATNELFEVVYRRIDSSKWAKIVGGVRLSDEYRLVSSRADEVLLKSQDVFIKLNNRELLLGEHPDRLETSCAGSWQTYNIIRFD